jgi:hypothetical protein
MPASRYNAARGRDAGVAIQLRGEQLARVARIAGRIVQDQFAPAVKFLAGDELVELQGKGRFFVHGLKGAVALEPHAHIAQNEVAVAQRRAPILAIALFQGGRAGGGNFQAQSVDVRIAKKCVSLFAALLRRVRARQGQRECENDEPPLPHGTFGQTSSRKIRESFWRHRDFTTRYSARTSSPSWAEPEMMSPTVKFSRAGPVIFTSPAFCPA